MRNLIIIVIAFGAFTSLIAQQNTTLFFMHKVPQSNFVNPSLQHECKLNFGGLLLPVAGQILPPVHQTMGTTGFSYKNLFYYEESIDSLMHPLHPDYDIDKLIKRLRKVNYIYDETHINLLNVGYQFKNKYYFTFSAQEKIDVKFSIPKDLIILGLEGNGQSFLGKTANLQGLGFSATYYREFALGASMVINKKLTLGAKPKLLFGQINAWTKSNSITWNTEANDFYYMFDVDYELNICQPFYGIKDMYYDYENDSMVMELDTLMDMDKPEIKKIVFSGKNPGFAIDLGATYIFNDKITLYASLIDLGFIRWKDNVNSLKVKGQLYFDGLEVTHYLQDDDSLNEEVFDNWKDSVIQIFEPEYQPDKYTSFLTPQLYIGGTYQLFEKYNFGFLYRGALFQQRYLSSITLSGTGNIKKWFSATITYSIINNAFMNMGAGVIFKAGPAQFYLVSDNVLAPIWPQSTRDFNIRMGINLLFGCNKKVSSTMIN
ncbi:MAG: DUF5723 family protein [Bacteroidota bacterium]